MHELRGGARRHVSPRVPDHRGPREDHKFAMLNMALTKSSEVAPDINAKTLKMVLQVEQRTVGALLNCSGKHQGRIVLAAAMKRSGLDIVASRFEQPASHQDQEQQAHRQKDQVSASSESENGHEDHPSHQPQQPQQPQPDIDESSSPVTVPTSES